MNRGVSNVNADGSLVTWDTTPFSQGVSRYAYKGIRYSMGQRPIKCVVKTFKNTNNSIISESISSKKAYESSIRYAKLFNKECSPSKLIEFVSPIFLSISTNTSNNPIFNSLCYRDGDIIAAEPFLEGNYEKYNSNTGWNNGHDVCQAFSHYTFVRSNSSLVICDLQGVEYSGKYILTDPAINSITCEYGCTDIGTMGILMFFYHHRCNSICQKLRLGQVRGESKSNPQMSTAYTWGII